MDVVGCGARWGWRPIGVGSKGVGGIGSSSCVGASGCKVVVRWSEGLGVGVVVAIGVCVRARCFLGGVGVPLCVSCVCPWGSGLCCGVGGRLFPLGVGRFEFGWFWALCGAGGGRCIASSSSACCVCFLRFVFALHW